MTRIGITGRFQNSYFSGSIPQVAISLARAFQIAGQGHDVTLLRPADDPDWFVDTHEHKSKVPPRAILSACQKFDIIIEVGWSLSPDDRLKYADKVFYFMHYPPIFYDMESSVYMWNSTVRDFKNLSAVVTYDFYGKQDVQYIELLSNKPVLQIPYIWDNEPLDAFVKEASVPSWSDTAKQAEAALPASIPKTMAWCARIVESNFSNSSSCIIPLNVVSVVRTRGCAIRFGVHNASQTAQSAFFQTNVAKNLLLPDISGAMIPRVRLPDLCREKTALIAHQRFRPIKSFLLDALYLGIPMIHNNAMLKQYGAPYFYELNQIQQAADQWMQMMSDYDAQKGFFTPRAADIRRAALKARFSSAAVAPALSVLLIPSFPVPRLITPAAAAAAQQQGGDELRIAFANMWDEFQPKHNFFMYLLSWVGKLNGIRVVHDDTHPNVVFFGPLSRGAESKYPGVPKVFFSGENAPKNTDKDTFLNLGFSYDVNYSNYVRLPLWLLEIDWWGADPAKVVNPKYVSLEDAMRVNPAVLDAKDKFCAFVATNPSNQNRNAAFQILNNWRHVDSGGRLFCNLPDGPIPAGLGGGGGELAKIEFYKKYKFALTFENSSSPGYCTEKLFHAKVAGCVPIYWGDPYVDRDFDPKGYINVNQVGSAEQLVEAVKKIADDPEAWRRIAEVPALSAFKKGWCEKTMEHVARLIFKHITHKEIAAIKESDWTVARNYATTMYETQGSEPAPSPKPALALSVPGLAGASQQIPEKRMFITATNAKYVEAAANAVASFRNHDKITPIHVYVWDDVPTQMYEVFGKVGANEIRKLPSSAASETPWADFWNPQHFAWKLWTLVHAMSTTEKDTSILYLDAGTVVASPLDTIWRQIHSQGIFLLNDDSQPNERWCHPAFCEFMQPSPQELAGSQITAGLIGFKVGHTFNTVFSEALAIAKSHRDVIVGEKWHKYSETCMGHRHDQSILSVLTQRRGCPRLPLKEFYCDTSLRAAQQFGTPLYVHRGQFKPIVPFENRIDEAYVINLERRQDRLETFKRDHSYMKEKTYVWKATDGRSLQLTPDIIHCFRNNDFGWKKAVMGCALSHLGLWEKLANDALAKSYLIMEDDVRFSPSWMKWWSEHAGDMPADADVVYLGGVLPPNKAAFPHIIEPVNSHFGHVKPNTIFGAPTPRRYFHFCNYAYLLTQSGARKLVQLVKERGIFTSGDHMIVNHGDELLKIYFTTPLLATCFQEEDPVYQKSDFNNFARVDNFDSDLWNNTDCFSKDELNACLTQALQTPAATNSAPKPSATPKPSEANSVESERMQKEDTIQMWNNFVKSVALKSDEIKQHLVLIFDAWSSYSIQQLSKNMSYFRVLEQLVIMDEPSLKPHRAYMLERIKAFPNKQFGTVFDKMQAALEDSKRPTNNGITFFERPPEKRITAFHMKEIDPSKCYEREWLDSIFPHPLEYKQFSSVHDLVAVKEMPIFVFQKCPSIDAVKVLGIVLDMIRSTGKQIVVLHLSDEFGNDDISWYAHPSLKAVVRNYWRPDLKSYLPEKVIVLPLGYANSRSGRGFPPKSFEEREYTWSFVGSLDREGREAALTQLQSVKPYKQECKASWDSPDIVKAEEYNTLLQKSKFVPCMRGSAALESFRLYEALEHGAIPIYVPSESSRCSDEYTEIYGKHPFLGFPSWTAAAEYLPKLAAQPQIMEKHRSQLNTWWNDKKTEFQVKLKSLFV